MPNSEPTREHTLEDFEEQVKLLSLEELIALAEVLRQQAPVRTAERQLVYEQIALRQHRKGPRAG